MSFAAQLNESFIEFMFDCVERPHINDEYDQIPYSIVSVILSFNQHFRGSYHAFAINIHRRKHTLENLSKGGFPRDELLSEFAANTRRKFAAAKFVVTTIYSANLLFISTLKRILAPLSPERSCNTITESKRHVHCFLHSDWFEATCETFRRKKVEFVSTFSSAHCQSKLLKLRMLRSVSRRIR